MSSIDLSAFALVTGAGTGIGRAVTVALAQRNYHVLAVGRRFTPLTQVANIATKNMVRPYSLDVGEPNAIADLLATIEGRLEVVVAAAGTFKRGTSVELSTSHWDEQIRVNLTGAFHSLRSAIKRMSMQDIVGGSRGHIFTMNSGAGVRGFASGSAYAASKHGLRGMVESMRLEIAGSKIKLTDLIINATVESEMSAGRDVAKLPASAVAQTLTACLDLPGSASWDHVEISQV